MDYFVIYIVNFQHFKLSSVKAFVPSEQMKGKVNQKQAFVPSEQMKGKVNQKQ